MKKTFILFVLMFSFLFPASSFATDDCSVPKALIVLDKSSSMTRNSINGHTLWYWATQAIENLVTTYDGRIDFGLMIYPGTNHCTTGQVVVDLAPGTATDIINAFQDPPPTNGYYTPIYQSLDAVTSYTPLQDSSSENYVIFLTDGWQSCFPYDATTRFYSVSSVEDIAALGISTAVIGFSGSVDATNLQRMAVKGGMPVSTCVPNATNIDDTNRCYFQADNSTELINALNSIALQITAEVCDGIDNNCDGNIDEGLFRSCSTVCGNGTEQCFNGQWLGCTAPQVHPEICDDIDNDCDGTVDEGCNCRDGQTRQCGKDDGQCEFGYQICETGLWSECRDAIWPTYEECNGLDDDCDGFVDENLSQECETVCGQGFKSCVNGEWSACSAPEPTEEVCNAIDDDCDGIVDNGDNLCPSDQECIEGICISRNDNDPDGGTLDGTGDETGDSTGDENGDKATAPDGCSCHSNSSTNTGNGILILLSFLASMLFFRRRSN